MIPFYQGQLDCFCAAYAVLNAMRLLYALPLSEARALFNGMLIELVADPEEFSAIALNAVDHTDWVRRLLIGLERGPRTVRVVEPFAAARTVFPRKSGPHALDVGKHLIHSSGGVSPEALWERLEDWIGALALHERLRAVVFRFHRYVSPDSFPVVSHWTTAGKITGRVLDLADASAEPTAVHSISRTGFVTAREHLNMEQLVQIEPGTLFLLERR